MAVDDPLQTLLAELKELHLRAGKPSCRSIATKLGPGGISHNTVNKVFKELTKRPYLEQVVRHLDGDVAHFVELWTEAKRTTESRSPPALPDASSVQEE